MNLSLYSGSEGTEERTENVSLCQSLIVISMNSLAGSVSSKVGLALGSVFFG